jgi:hypothetical protein
MIDLGPGLYWAEFRRAEELHPFSQSSSKKGITSSLHGCNPGVGIGKELASMRHPSGTYRGILSEIEGLAVHRLRVQAPPLTHHGSPNIYFESVRPLYNRVEEAKS